MTKQPLLRLEAPRGGLGRHSVIAVPGGAAEPWLGRRPEWAIRDLPSLQCQPNQTYWSRGRLVDIVCWTVG